MCIPEWYIKGLLGRCKGISVQMQVMVQAAVMPKPVPADAMSQQPTEASYDRLKAQEEQEDAQVQTMAAQSSNGAAPTSQPVQAQSGGLVPAVQTKLQEALKPSRSVLSCLQQTLLDVCVRVSCEHCLDFHISQQDVHHHLC